jgi:carbonic anhydrase
MSVFKDANQWADKYKSCGAPRQSPVNLSRSFALPCDRLCELQIDKVSVTQGSVSLQKGVLFLAFTSGSGPSAKFNGEGYQSKGIALFHPAQHTIENVRSEAELVCYFTNPKGRTLAVSFPVRTAAGETESTSFFNKFVPYYVEGQATTVNLGDSWSIQSLVPENRGFYVYEGTDLVPKCEPDVTWVVFATAITIDPSDFAKLSARVPGGNRPLQPVGDRQVFYNDGETIEPGVPSDGKMYMKCRRIPRKGEISSSDAKAAIRQGNLIAKDQELTEQNRKQAISNMETKLGDAYASIGGAWGIISVLTFAGIAFFLFSEKGAPIARSLFGILVMIPAYIHKYTFGLILG